MSFSKKYSCYPTKVPKPFVKFGIRGSILFHSWMRPSKSDSSRSGSNRCLLYPIKRRSIRFNPINSYIVCIEKYIDTQPWYTFPPNCLYERYVTAKSSTLCASTYYTPPCHCILFHDMRLYSMVWQEASVNVFHAMSHSLLWQEFRSMTRDCTLGAQDTDLHYC